MEQLNNTKTKYGLGSTILTIIVLAPFLALLYLLIDRSFTIPTWFGETHTGLNKETFISRKTKDIKKLKNQRGDLFCAWQRYSSFLWKLVCDNLRQIRLVTTFALDILQYLFDRHQVNSLIQTDQQNVGYQEAKSKINFWYTSTGKRTFDFCFALLAIILLSPFLTLLYLLVHWRLGAPVLFRQPRVGLNGNTFVLLKFRTMNEARDQNGELLPDSERLTSFGQFLRNTSLDELPELFNILRGDMSLIGPRPLLLRYLPRYSPVQARRHEVRPGLTGWAQINGRNAISWEEKFRLDVWYVDNYSLWLDIKILVSTALKVLKREGISQQGQATMEEFVG